MNAALARFSMALGLLFGAASTPAQLAVKDRLLLADDFKSLPAYTKEYQPLGVGHSPHELRRLRVYAATANPGWAEPAAPPPTPLAGVPPRPALKAATGHRLARMTPLFDGQTLDGWIQSPASPSGIDRREVIDVAGFARRILGRADPVAAFIHDQLDAPALAGLAAALAGKTDSRQTLGPAMKCLNALLQDGTSLYDAARFRNVALRPKTRAVLDRPAPGAAVARLNRLLLEDAFARELVQIPDTGWVARDGVLASTGAGRGVIYTARDYENYRLVFQVRQESGPQFDHYPGVLLFCQRPPVGEPGLDALGGIQFAVPSAGHWDYRPGINRSGDHFRRPLRLRFDVAEWAQVEILVNGRTGTARMAIAQPVGTRAIEVLGFNDPAAARRGPLALQMHNARLFDEYKDLRIEVDPAEPDKLILLD